MRQQRLTTPATVTKMVQSDPVHTGPDPYGHHINIYLKSLKTSMTLKFVIILQNLIKAYHRKSGKSKYDRKLTELDVETARIRTEPIPVKMLDETQICFKSLVPQNRIMRRNKAWERLLKSCQKLCTKKPN